jgi:ankyrin repeat protein
LIAAVTSGNLDGVRAAINNGADVNTVTIDEVDSPGDNTVWARIRRALGIRTYVPGSPALVLAASFDNREIVLEMLRHGARVNVADESGWTPLMYAAKRGDDELSTEFLRYGANVNSRSRDGISSLQIAAGVGKHGLVERLLTVGADPNVKSVDGETPLIEATFVGNADSAKEFLEHGADPGVKDKRGRTALFWAAVLYRDIHNVNNDIKPNPRSTGIERAWGLIANRSLEAERAGHRLSDKQILQQLERDYKDIVIRLEPFSKNVKQVDSSGESADAIISQIVRKEQR